LSKINDMPPQNAKFKDPREMRHKEKVIFQDLVPKSMVPKSMHSRYQRPIYTDVERNKLFCTNVTTSVTFAEDALQHA